MTTAANIKRVTEPLDVKALKPASATVELTYDAETGEFISRVVSVEVEPGPLNDELARLEATVLQENGTKM